MRLILLILFTTALAACNSSNTDKNIPGKTSRESVKADIVGVWELLKMNYSPTDSLSLVDPRSKEYVEIKADGTCQDGQYKYQWFLSYTDEYVFDSISKILFTEASNLKPNSWGNYERELRPYQVKVTSEGTVKYLYLTSLKTSGTRVFIRKN